MNYHVNSTYLIEMECSDGYGSTDTQILTFQVEENTPPVLNNLPGNVDIRVVIDWYLSSIFCHINSVKLLARP